MVPQPRPDRRAPKAMPSKQARLRAVNAKHPAEPALAPPATAAAASAWDRYAAGFVAGYFEAHPTFAAAAGRHEYDGLLPDWSRAGLEGEARRLSGLRRAAVQFDAAALDPNRRMERELLLAQIDGDLFWLEEAGRPPVNPLFSAPALDPSPYGNREYAPAAERARAFARYARGVPRALAPLRANPDPSPRGAG